MTDNVERVEGWRERFDGQYTSQRAGKYWKEGMAITPSMIKSFIDDLLTHRETELLTEFRETALRILEENFPKMNQEDVSKPSPNGRSAVMAFVGLLLAALTPPSTEDKRTDL